MKLSPAFTKEGREKSEAAQRQRKREKRSRQLLRTAGSDPETLALGWAEAEQRAIRAEIAHHPSCLAVDEQVEKLEAEVAGMRDKWTPPDEVAELQIDLSKPPGERKYCAGCTLPELESEIRIILTPDPNFKGTLPSWEPIKILLAGGNRGR